MTTKEFDKIMQNYIINIIEENHELFLSNLRQHYTFSLLNPEE